MEQEFQREHISKQYEEELNELKNRILGMARDLMEMITRTIRSLSERDSDLASQMIEFDTQIDRQEVEIDDLSLKIIALRQPAAGDLRFITLALKISTDLERIGDLCVNIAERALELNKEPQLKLHIDLPKMAEATVSMIKDSLEAFIKQDDKIATDVLRRDDFVDQLNEQVFKKLLTCMMKNPKNIDRATRLMFISKYMERMADHATNIAEMVIFMVKGRDVRHMGIIEEKDKGKTWLK